MRWRRSSAIRCRLSAFCGRESDCQTSDWHGAWERIFPHTAGHMAKGDFSTALRSARNDIGGQDGQTVELCYRLWAVCFSREDLGQSDFRLALCLEMHLPLAAGYRGQGDFSTLWRLCIESPSQPKLAFSLPNKRLSYWRLTGYARNDVGEFG